MDRSLSFASTPTDYGALLGLAFAAAPPLRGLTSPVRVTRRLIMQKARRHPSRAETPTACRHMVSGTISLPCSGYFSPFPYGTGALSVSREYLALPDGAGRFTQDFTGPALLRILLSCCAVRLQGFHLLWLRFPARFSLAQQPTCSPTTPSG